MNIVILLIYILTSIIFGLALLTIVKAKNKNVFAGLYAQFFIINIMALIFCLFKIYEQFSPEDVIKIIDQFLEICFILCAINVVYIIKIIWDMNKGKKIGLKNNLPMLVFLLLIEFIVIGSSWTAFYFYEKSENIVLNQYEDYLYTVANSRASYISRLVLDYKNKILADSTLNFGIINCLEGIESNNGTCNKEQMDEIVAKRLNSSMDSPYFIAVLNQSGKVVSSTDNSLAGEDWSLKEAFINHTKDGYFSNIFFDEKYNQQAIEVSHPIVKNNSFLGVWILRERPEDIYNVLQDRKNLGDTGEAFLVDINGIVLSPQRFNNEILTKINNPNVVACRENFERYVKETPTSLIVEKHDVSVVEYTNKFGRRILGAHAVIEGPTKGLKWCVLVEIGREEALGDFNKNLLKAAILSLIVIIVFVCIFIFTFDFFFQKLFKANIKE